MRSNTTNSVQQTYTNIHQNISVQCENHSNEPLYEANF